MPRLSTRRPSPSTPAVPRWATIALWILIILFSVYFAALAFNLHAAHRTHQADLGQIDLAIWNTSQGRLLQEIKGEQISTRLTDHVEPIFAPVSLVFYLWNDVRALLALQAIALALGAWPVFYLAWGRLGRSRQGSGETRRQRGEKATAQERPAVAGASPYQALAALAFAIAYLLYPPMQAAIAAEFHAMPLATPLILLAFLFSERQQWARFTLAALAVAMVQEGAALLTALLGLYAIARSLHLRRSPHSSLPAPRSPLLAGLLVTLAGLAWFAAATFWIIPAYAAQAYGIAETPYAARFGALGDSFGDVLRSLLTRPGLVLGVALEPLRVQYLLKLLAPVGFLSLAGPEILLLGLPLLLANLLSGFPFQYSGQLHYSAPLAAYAVFAAIVGGQRLRRLIRRTVAGLRLRRLRRLHRAFLPMTLWVLVWSIGCQIAWGYTPIGSQFQNAWPEVTTHHRLLDRFLAQIPPDASVSTMPSLYPHVSHREGIYRFPALGDSQLVLLDIAATTGWAMHPADMRREVDRLLDSGWVVQDASDGYLLLRKAASGDTAAEPRPGGTQFPREFYSFAQPATEPQVPTDITFTSPGGAQVKLVGYDVWSDEQWRSTAFRFYWQALTPLPEDTTLRAFVMTPDGREVDSTDVRPLIQPLWWPTEDWPVGETIVTHKLPWYLPKQWAPAVGVYDGASWDDAARRWQVSTPTGETRLFDSNTWALLDGWQWRNNSLEPLVAPEFAPADAAFGGDGWTVQLTGLSERKRAAPGQRVPVLLQWQTQGPAPRDYTIFLHLRDAAGNTVAQSDSTPTEFGALPTTAWRSGQPVWSGHSLQLPASLPPGVYDLVVGWYYWETLERLALLGPDGQPTGDSATVGRIEVDTTAGPQPDFVCALIPETCESQ